jgi:chorismate lyase
MMMWVSNFDAEVIKPPASVLAWMQTKTSITEQAKQHCGVVRLEVLNEQWEQEQETPMFVREINMYCDEKIAWYARTWIPQKTYNRRSEKFQSLQSQPLGKILYNDPDITRKDSVYAYLNSSMPEYQWSVKHYSGVPPHYLWARKSIFQIDGEPLYLMEVFFNVPEF